MSPRAWLLLSWILVGALVLLLHAVVLVSALFARGLDWRWRVAALVPPLAPLAAWAAGRRAAPVAWLVAVVSYCALRLLE